MGRIGELFSLVVGGFLGAVGFVWRGLWRQVLLVVVKSNFLLSENK